MGLKPRPSVKTTNHIYMNTSSNSSKANITFSGREREILAFLVNNFSIA
jgi:hypothetical protein